MLRRLSLLIALGLGCIGLVWGLLHLQGIFLDEREDALAAIASRRLALEQFAHKELEQRLQRQLDEARPTIDAAGDDPLLPASDVLLVDRGKQLLPRTAAFKPDDDGPATALLARLKGDEPELEAERAFAEDPTSPWAERVELLVAFRSALRTEDRAGVERNVRLILGHRARFRIRSTQDIPFMVALLDRLTSDAKPQRKLMVDLLRDGLRVETNMEGLQRALLRQRTRFSRRDMVRLKQEIVRLSEAHQVFFNDFADRVGEPPAQRIVLPRALDEATLIRDGSWYIAPPQNERIRGKRIDLQAVLEEISVAMRERGLIGSDDHVRGEAKGPALTVASAALTVESPTWAPAAAAVESRYRLKAFLEVLIAVLTFGLMALAVVIYRRKQRFVELKSDFVSAVSHELRTPLASIRLMAETLERKTKGIEKVRDYPSRIVRDVDGLSLLVENILSFNRLSRGKWTPQLEALSLAEVLHKLDEERDSWEKRPAELTLECPDAVMLRADRELVPLLLTNLLRNACTYNQREPIRLAVRVQAAPPGRDGRSDWLIEVEDNGVGILESERERIFDDFYRAPSRSGDRARGSGLGLAICRKIAEAHGGGIRVARSSAEGTVFELRLPGAASQPA